MLQRYIVVISLLFVLFPPLLLANNSNQNEILSTEDKLYGLSLLWKEASYNFAFFDQVPDLDFDAAYQDAIPKVLATNNTFEYYRELQRFMALLKDGHTGVYFPENIAEKHFNWPGVWAVEVKGEAIIVAVDKTLESKIPLGSKVVSVNGLLLDQHLSTKVIPFLNDISTKKVERTKAIQIMLGEGIEGSEVTIGIRTLKMELKEVRLIRDTLQRKRDYAFLDVYMPFMNNNQALTEFKWLDNNIAYIALNSFYDVKVVDIFKQYFHEVQKADALIIDIRSNGGGMTNIGTDILSYLIDEDVYGAKWKTPKHIAAYKAWGRYKEGSIDFQFTNAWETGDMPVVSPQENPLIVPTYVLIGRGTVSAAEDFLVYTDKISHFTTIGENTYGSTGQPLTVDLPGGGKARICTKRDTYPDGREFVGIGIKPDIFVERNVNDIINERDVVLLRAITEARKQIVNQ
ncbi:peptidase S41 [Aliivibrio finisterrensis]|uniref:Peptidase S41 n=1 Tax=Aliivibrio finisterrensis TaxID=511998 RepID=A0A4Q5KKR1_9GAMM|nr:MULTISPECIES: S41 family peptidase [Aliivibrio]MDD9173635.1 S41 family peptidase [Aliivibrio sp. S3TY1]MDD9190711.1 S41 family peptidase [Aliivibrio sp. S2TY2]RYU46944.1 peptidase S41 [Aliivibrio finisterrensis]